MQLTRPAFAPHPMSFGRRAAREQILVERRASQFASDARLFATTFVGGFLFVSVLIG